MKDLVLIKIQIPVYQGYCILFNRFKKVYKVSSFKIDGSNGRVEDGRIFVNMPLCSVVQNSK